MWGSYEDALGVIPCALARHACGPEPDRVLKASAFPPVWVSAREMDCPFKATSPRLAYLVACHEQAFIVIQACVVKLALLSVGLIGRQLVELRPSLPLFQKPR